MEYSVLRHKSHDDTWAWLFAFAFATLGTIAATSYVAMVMAQALLQVLVDGNKLGHRVFEVSAPIYAGVVSIVLVLAVTMWLYASVGKRGRSVERLLADLGARPIIAGTSDLRIRRLLNVHEEIAIACGLEPPAIYLMEGEESINAFTAGTTPDDTIVCITYGALRTLKRAELQAVLAHEYGHILSGDVRRNTRLLFFLDALIPFGGEKGPSAYLLFLKLMGFCAVMTLPSAFFRHGGMGFAIVLVLTILATLVWIPTKTLGLLWKLGAAVVRATQAAVARRRELAADAASAQFTRDPGALASALRKVAGLDHSQRLVADQAQSVAHMCFAPALVGRDEGLFAAHPPMEDRLRQLGFPADLDEQRQLDERRGSLRDLYASEVDEELGILLLAEPSAATPASAAPPASAPIQKPFRPYRPAVPASAALAAIPDLEHAVKLLGRIPDELRAELRKPAGALAAAHALLGTAAPDKSNEIENAFAVALDALDEQHRLPLLELVIPTLRAMRHGMQSDLIMSLRERIKADSRVTLREAVYFNLLTRPLRQDKPKPAWMHPGDAFALLIGAAAHASASSADAARAAFEAGRERMFPRATSLPPGDKPDFARLDDALNTLALLSVDRRRVVRAAVTRVIAHDGNLTAIELELVRAVSSALYVPLPPMAVPDQASDAALAVRRLSGMS
jgi:Zn-dependent protease with chaperone function